MSKNAEHSHTCKQVYCHNVTPQICLSIFQCNLKKIKTLLLQSDEIDGNHLIFSFSQANF